MPGKHSELKKRKVPRIAWLGEKKLSESFSKILPPPQFLVYKNKKKKVLRIVWFGEKIDQKNLLKINLYGEVMSAVPYTSGFLFRFTVFFV